MFVVWLGWRGFWDWVGVVGAFLGLGIGVEGLLGLGVGRLDGWQWRLEGAAGATGRRSASIAMGVARGVGGLWPGGEAVLSGG